MRKELLLVLALTACPKKDEAPKPVAAPPPVKVAEPAPPAKAAKAECEFIGTWSPGDTKPASVEFVAQAEPCLPFAPAAVRFGQSPVPTPDTLFAEFFIPQGTSGYLCLYGKDAAGKVIAAAAHTAPVKFEGDGEVMFSGLKFELTALPTAPVDQQN